jgi:Ca2+-binding EF-hand superfamily protein
LSLLKSLVGERWNLAIQSVANHSGARVLSWEASQSRPHFFISREIDMSQDLIVRKFKHMFRRFDVDGSGTVNRLDFQMVPAWITGRLGEPLSSPVHKKLQAAYDMVWDQIAGMDANGDGSLTEAEWLDGWTKAANSGSIEQVIAQAADLVFECVDTSGDGEIGADEFSTWLCAHGATDAIAAEAFPKLDFNGDGRISKAENRKNVCDFFTSTAIDARGNWQFGTGW